MVICLERGAVLNMAQLMPLPLTVSCFSKIQIGFAFLVPAHLGSAGKGQLNWCLFVCLFVCLIYGVPFCITSFCDVCYFCELQVGEIGEVGSV